MVYEECEEVKIDCKGEWVLEECPVCYDEDIGNKRWEVFHITRPKVNGGQDCKGKDGITKRSSAQICVGLKPCPKPYHKVPEGVDRSCTKGKRFTGVSKQK